MNENEPLTKAEIEAALPLPQSRAVAEAVGTWSMDAPLEPDTDLVISSHYTRGYEEGARDAGQLRAQRYALRTVNEELRRRIAELEADRAAQATPAEGTAPRAERSQAWWLAMADKEGDADVNAGAPAPTDGADVGEADVRRALDAYWDAYNSEMVRSLEPGLAHPAGIGAAILADRAARPHPSAPREFAACPDLGPIGLDEAPS